MRKIELKEVHKIELNMLKIILEFCKKNNIKMYLGGGTLLGAIRHNGFIPWDDDIDLHTGRDDYERFLNLYPKDGINGCVLCRPNDYVEPQNAFSCIKNIYTLKYEKGANKYRNKEGIAIDIFPIDGVPNDEKELNKYYFKQEFYSKLLIGMTNVFYFKGNFFILLIKFAFSFVCKLLKVLNILQPIKIINKINNEAKKYRIVDCDRIACSIFLHYGKNEIFNKKGFEESIEVSFEGYKCYVQSNYDEYLTNLYGKDYMKIPDESKQISHHKAVFCVSEDFHY